MVGLLKKSAPILLIAFFVFPILAWASSASDSINVNLVVRPGGGGGGQDCPPNCPEKLEIINVAVTPGSFESLIERQTNLSALSVFSWGLTPDYELGAIALDQAALAHQVLLEGLESETVYYYRIVASEAGNPSNTDTEIGIFLTLPPPDLNPPANPSDFRAIYDVDDNVIRLFWINPADPDFALVRIMRSTSFYPADPFDGELVYQGDGEEAIDSQIDPDTVYYYTIFARDFSANWSSGAIAREKTPKPGVRPEEEIIEDPFLDFPEVEVLSPEIQKIIDELYFDFIQDEKIIARFRSGDVDIDASQPFKVSVAYEKLPEVLKTIAVTLSAPDDPSRTFTFLLRVNEDKAFYTASVDSLLIPGIYPMQITLLDFKNQKITRFPGRLTVYGTTPLIGPAATRAFRRFAREIAPFGAPIGLAAAGLQTLVLVFHLKSLYDIYLLILRFFGAFLGFLGLRRRRPPWGTVYDAVTKQPLDPAYVRVLAGGAEVANAITDLDGRYGFFLPSGSYQLVVNKTNYQFPSKILSGRGRDELYANLYFGEPIQSREGEIINRNVPLDPIGFDWNEFVKNKRGLFKLYSRHQRLKNVIFNSLFLLGFLFSLLAVIVTPIAFNFIVIGLYLALFFFQIFWKFRHRVLSVFSDLTREPLPFSIIRVYLPEVNQEVKTVVADELGRFYLLVSPGKYYFTVEAKQPDGSYSQVYRSGIIELGRGVLSSDIYVNTFQPTPARSWI